ncbi:hypothetical protein HNP99_001992 [Flavobacterium sp. 28A]|uniref:hypothetical protein n=1 Tax=Flavobacterium sp. 28A TaxID=2735895 RepID=UPI00156F9D91|nr:hypothetical protein [Flavobacterium sp. 28A]NRT15635.1 hypothetical protein [Flavobacterium sp. 28A]
MKKAALLLLLIVVFSCKKEGEKSTNTKTEIAKTDSIVYNTNDFQPHLKLEDEFSEFELTGLKNPEKFTAVELTYPIKENEFDFKKSADFDYFTVNDFNVDKTKCKIIAFSSYGENDSKIVNLQLNSYQSGEQKDALLLDCRFTFETEYYRNFEIKKDGTVIIKKIAVNGLLYNNEGDITGEKAVNDTTTEVVKYKMNANGQFVKF